MDPRRFTARLADALAPTPHQQAAAARRFAPASPPDGLPLAALLAVCWPRLGAMADASGPAFPATGLPVVDGGPGARLPPAGFVEPDPLTGVRVDPEHAAALGVHPARLVPIAAPARVAAAVAAAVVGLPVAVGDRQQRRLLCAALRAQCCLLLGAPLAPPVEALSRALAAADGDTSATALALLRFAAPDWPVEQRDALWGICAAVEAVGAEARAGQGQGQGEGARLLSLFPPPTPKAPLRPSSSFSCFFSRFRSAAEGGEEERRTRTPLMRSARCGGACAQRQIARGPSYWRCA